MPAETVAQERVWMAYPVAGYSLGDTETEHEEARATWAAVAHAVADFEPVTVIVDPGEISHARRHLSSEITLVEAPLDDAWARDIGPTFVLDENGALGAVDWVFNGWGAADWATWDSDQHIATLIAELSGAELVDSPMINEGGGIQVDGAGTVLLTETVQRGEGRNSTWTREQVEAELARTIGTTTAIWLPRGLTRDNDTFGTRGHVDIVAAFPTPGTVLVHDQTDRGHPDHAVTAEIIELLSAATDAAGSVPAIVRVPAPRNLRDAGGFVDHSYINHLVVNGGVIACAFDDPSDAPAAEILGAAYPGREVVTVDARPLFVRGGGIHCITCQQPTRRYP
ncbi:agmatine deiminase [Williamsia sp. Leaf354]|jgi:agmatine deiminase|uniref:agmatine deiminase family protein n=1 Tax=Williamsia sp. Leaf354 TaxID=1736349 RepID=UPI0006F93136|nr:agmatine deiminase family protein [Williamsia sp. Leaf354]KQR96678.1 agmatine deiminase [Williamsia sp. Leaf354]